VRVIVHVAVNGDKQPSGTPSDRAVQLRRGLACGFRREGIRREAELYPDGWKDFIMMGTLRSEHGSRKCTSALLLLVSGF
jgi:hypothetical protein